MSTPLAMASTSSMIERRLRSTSVFGNKSMNSLVSCSRLIMRCGSSAKASMNSKA
jgi:hypothetical protein